mgnify:CR=1 FL=1
MLDMNKGWNNIDKNNEELVLNDIVFKRPVEFDYCLPYCPCCNNVISTTDDVEKMKKEGVCEDCYITYYYINKEKWDNGWRPYKKNM